jgi:TRAP-type C4-dicarboxylate transport system permease large subunit
MAGKGGIYMSTVLIPIIVLFVLVLAPIPLLKKNVGLAFLVTALVAVLLGGIGFNEFLDGAIKGIDGISWVLFLIIFASIYTQSQFTLGSVETVLNLFRSIFGKSTKGLITAILLSLVFAGSIIGSATASAVVIGVLVIPVLNEAQVKPNKIGAILLLDAIIGSIMPPITQAVFLASSLLKVNMDPVVNMTYLTAGVGTLIALFVCRRYADVDRLPPELIPDRKPGRILAEEWTLLIPVLVFAVLVFLRAINIDLLKPTDFIWNVFKKTPILRAFTNRFVQSIIIATLIGMLYPKVFKSAHVWVAKGLHSVGKPSFALVSAGIMIGAFQASGMIDKIIEFAKTLSPAAIKFGSGGSLLLMGMLTGSQSTTQSSLVPLVGPILVNAAGVNPSDAALGLAHLAMAGQSFPPVCLLSIMLAAMISSAVGKDSDAVKIMMLSFPVTFYFAAIGFLALFGVI